MPKSEHHILFGLALGLPGVLTFAGNIVPDRLVAMLSAWQEGDHAKARKIYLECLPLFDAIHIEPVPNAIFYLFNQMGWKMGCPRLPGHELRSEHRRTVDMVLHGLNLITE